MADFEKSEKASEKESDELEMGDAATAAQDSTTTISQSMVDFSNPVIIVYCPHCTMPSEYCQFGPLFKEKCLPHMQANMSEIELASALGQVSLEGGIKDVGGKKSRIISKEAAVFETKVIIARIQRQRKKYVTSVGGLDTVASLKGKLDDAAKFFKKKFSCGASVSETPSGSFEVIIQGDVSLELPEKLMTEYKITPGQIWFLEAKDNLRCYA